MARRRTVGLDADMVDDLKAIASRRGMSLASYLRNLLATALELERRGLYAPKALGEKRVEHLLRSFNFVYLPADAVSDSLSNGLLRRVREFGERLGATLRELGMNVFEVVEFLSTSAGIAIHEGDKLIVPQFLGTKGLLAEVVKGLTVGGGLEYSEGRGVFTIKIPPEIIREMTKGVEGARRGRARPTGRLR